MDIFKAHIVDSFDPLEQPDIGDVFDVLHHMNGVLVSFDDRLNDMQTEIVGIFKILEIMNREDGEGEEWR